MKVLIVEDHPIVRAGFRRLLGEDPTVEIVEAVTGRDGYRLFCEARPDLVLLDLNLPGLGGLEVLDRMLHHEPAARILVVSMHDDPVFASRALQGGALGYVSKSSPPERLSEAVRRVAGGQRYLDHEIAQSLALRSVNAEPGGDPLSPLSRRDLEILRLVGEGQSLAQIAHALGLSYKTVANNCTQIKTKLGLPRTADLVRFALNRGIAQS